MTTNCLMRPRETYKDRIFTTNVVGWDGVKSVSYTHLDVYKRQVT